jgi:arabinose-5-phosphate isomerase
MTNAPRSAPTGDDERARERAFAQRVLSVEADAISRVRLDEQFHAAVDLLASAGDTAPARIGTVVVSGLGKSGLIGRKISATLASTGTPSHFIHPVEAMHGDLGRVIRGDTVLLLSFGGNTEEVVALAAVLRQDEVPVVAITGTRDCDLARLATVTLPIGDLEEACPNNLAPTASTTAMLALGDALALCASHRRGFGVDEFRRFHPGGKLGNRLKPVLDAVRFRVGRNLPLAPVGATVARAYETAETEGNRPRLAGALLVVHEGGRLAGIFTDADLRRLLLARGAQGWLAPLAEVMTSDPRHLTQSALVRDAEAMVRAHRIDEIPIVDADGKPVALLDVQDLVALKVIEE